MASDFGTFIIQLLWIWVIIMFIFIWFMVIMDLFSDHTMGGFAKAISSSSSRRSPRWST
jgi:hypothetical protein